MRPLAIRRELVVVLAVLGAACMGPSDLPLTRSMGAVGEPMNGFPSPIERLGLMAINRARSDPQTVKGASSASYPARPPVIWSLPLNQSARFHAVNLRATDVTLMHDSPCPLNTDVASSGCTGDPSCACASPVPTTCAMCAKVAATSNGCGSTISTRLGYFTSGTTVKWTGEVAAAGDKDPIATVNAWMDEASGDDGHRRNLTDQGITSNTMGFGHASGTPACFSTFDISDSGNIPGATIPQIPTAAVSPASGNAGTFTFYATWADSKHGAPASLNVVLDGSCEEMTRELGTDTLNATYLANIALAAGCHEYWISATDATGAAVAYPTTGALTISVGGTACSSEYVATATGSCSPNGTGGAAGGGVSTGGASGSGGTPAASGGAPGSGGTPAASGGAPATGGAASGGVPGGGGRPGGGGGAGGAAVAGAAGSGSSGGCSCDLGATSRVSLLGLLPLLVLLRRRRTT